MSAYETIQHALRELRHIDMVVQSHIGAACCAKHRCANAILGEREQTAWKREFDRVVTIALAGNIAMVKTNDEVRGYELRARAQRSQANSNA